MHSSRDLGAGLASAREGCVHGTVQGEHQETHSTALGLTDFGDKTTKACIRKIYSIP